MARIVGIDLGTTNSLVAYMDKGTPRVIAGRHERAMVPSVVALTDNGLIVGDPAKEHLTRNPERTVYSVKRFMGKGLADVQDELAYFPYTLTEKGGVIRIKLGEKTYSPPQISAMILKELKLRAEAFLGESITKAVITVPAYFNDSQRQATKDAGMIAGLEVLRIINEPTAASLAYGLQEKTQGTIAVYDLGGGTFDISILKLKNGIFEVLATNGDTHLGGDDFDQLIADIFVADIRQEYGLDLKAHPDHMQGIRLEVERAKIRLSDELKTTVNLELPDGKGLFTRE
ncbi:MAG: Hsp70 family protein, partial [Nitrospiraceae bacterium]|nr:Hsp70 family protein [Nitrospiraceae bacterium]